MDWFKLFRMVSEYQKNITFIEKWILKEKLKAGSKPAGSKIIDDQLCTCDGRKIIAE